MATTIAPWNLLQIAFILVYPAWQSFLYLPHGMTLLASYLFLIILCVPPVFIQLKLGNHQQKGIFPLLSTHIPILKGVGITLLIQLFLTCVYIVPYITHIGMYAFIAIGHTPYVWSKCDNIWNTDICIQAEPPSSPGPQYQPAQSSLAAVAEAEFFDHEYLQISNNISDIQGFAVWHFSDKLKNANISVLPLAMVAVWTFVFLTMAFGARVCGWILFLLGPGFLALTFTVLGWGYSHLDSNGTNTFLDELYNVDVSQFSKLDEPAVPVIKDWIRGLTLVMISVPVWTAILPTMGKMTGNGRLSRNISWLFVILVYAATCQIPQLSMSPYIGNLRKMNNGIRYNTHTGTDIVFATMAAAFSALEVPHVYAMLFYLSVFIGGLMFVIVAMFTILDNLVDIMIGFSDRLVDKRGCVNFWAGFALVLLSIGTSLILTTQAGMYYIVLMDRSSTKLGFLTVAVYSICLIIIFLKMNFGIVERIIMSVWCAVSALITSAILLYSFIDTIDDVPYYHNNRIQGLQDLFCWIVASVPFLAIPACMIQACGEEEGTCAEKIKYVFCGIKQDAYDPPEEYGYHHPDPSAPPYNDSHSQHTYAYMDDSYPMNDMHYYKTTD